MLQFYNTLTRKLEKFKSLQDSKVGLYTCGPTVYNTPHIGNWRAFLWEDLLKRYLEYKGYHVNHVMNLTDVDDKTIKGSQQEGKTLDAFTQQYKNEFFEQLKQLNAKPANQYPEATKHIPEMVRLVQTLLEKGLAYRGEDNSIYFDIKKFKKYGKLSKLKLKKLKSGARVNQDEYEKQSASDFALWKAWSETDGAVYWETELGKGRPGWHIECSAMSTRYLGETFDIHTGGIDNLFPHHENEIAQSEGASGKRFVKYWLHCKHLLVNGQKMSKSLGNFYRLSDLKEFPPKTIRFALLFSHYRKPADFRIDETKKLDAKRNQLNETIQKLLKTIQQPGNTSNEKKKETAETLSKTTLEKFETALDNDLNTPQAFSVLFEYGKKTNEQIAKGITAADAYTLLETFEKMDSVLGILDFEPPKEESLPPELMTLVKKREELRSQKKWQEADELRKQLAEKGIELQDTANGTEWKKHV